MSTWNDLTMREKAAFMQTAIKRGYSDLTSIKKAYNKFAEGGPEGFDFKMAKGPEVGFNTQEAPAVTARPDAVPIKAKATPMPTNWYEVSTRDDVNRSFSQNKNYNEGQVVKDRLATMYKTQEAADEKLKHMQRIDQGYASSPQNHVFVNQKTGSRVNTDDHRMYLDSTIPWSNTLSKLFATTGHEMQHEYFPNYVEERENFSPEYLEHINSFGYNKDGKYVGEQLSEQINKGMKEAVNTSPSTEFSTHDIKPNERLPFIKEVQKDMGVAIDPTTGKPYWDYTTGDPIPAGVYERYIENNPKARTRYWTDENAKWLLEHTAMAEPQPTSLDVNLAAYGGGLTSPFSHSAIPAVRYAEGGHLYPDGGITYLDTPRYSNGIFYDDNGNAVGDSVMLPDLQVMPTRMQDTYKTTNALADTNGPNPILKMGMELLTRPPKQSYSDAVEPFNFATDGSGPAGHTRDNIVNVANYVRGQRDRLQQYGMVKDEDGYHYRNPYYHTNTPGQNNDSEYTRWCAENANLFNRAVKRPTTNDAWLRHGIYGDSALVVRPDVDKANYKWMGHTIGPKVLNAMNAAYVADHIDDVDLQTGDIVDINHFGSDYTQNAWNHGDKDRSNSHTGSIIRTGPNKKDVYVLHYQGNGKIDIEPIGPMIGNGLTKKNVITGIRRPGTKNHPYPNANIHAEGGPKGFLATLDDYADKAELPLSMANLGAWTVTGLAPNPVTPVVAYGTSLAGAGVDAYQALRAASKGKWLDAASNLGEVGLGLFGASGAKAIHKGYKATKNAAKALKTSAVDTGVKATSTTKVLPKATVTTPKKKSALVKALEANARRVDAYMNKNKYNYAGAVASDYDVLLKGNY